VPGQLPAKFHRGWLPAHRDIQRLSRLAGEQERLSRLRIPEKATGKQIAILGAGPAGLPVPPRLLEAGHAVTIFDRNTAFGGAIESVIPPNRAIQLAPQRDHGNFRRCAEEPDEPVSRQGTRLSAQPGHNPGPGLRCAFIGLGLSQSVSVTKLRFDGLWNAMDFLSAAKQERRLDLAGKSVAVIGGGNTAMDVAVTAVHAGSPGCLHNLPPIVQEMPAWGAEQNRAWELCSFPHPDANRSNTGQRRETHRNQAVPDPGSANPTAAAINVTRPLALLAAPTLARGSAASYSRCRRMRCREFLLDLARHVDDPRHAGQRMLRRRIPATMGSLNGRPMCGL